MATETDTPDPRPPHVGSETNSGSAESVTNRAPRQSPAVRARSIKERLKGTLLNKTYIADTKLRRSLISALETHARGVVLDVGCGSQPYAAQIKGHPAVDSYIGLEHPGAVDYFGEPLTNIEVLGDAQSLPMDDEFADVVLCSEVIEHVPEPELAVREAYRVLKPAGIYILTVPSTFKLHMEPYDFSRFTKYGLQHVLAKTGFEVLELCSRGRAPAALGQAVVSYLHEALVLRRDTGQPSAWRAALMLPILAGMQATALFLDQFSRSEAFTIGYTVVSRKPADPKLSP